MKTLQQIIKETAELKAKSTELTKNYNQESERIARELKQLKRLEEIALADFNIEKVQLAEKVISCSGNVDGLVDGRKLTDLAANDIANGHPHLKNMYYGNKRYEGFYQSCDCQYGYGPRHGSIVDQIEMKQESRGQVLCDEEIEACIYYLKNYAKIKAAITV